MTIDIRTHPLDWTPLDQHITTLDRPLWWHERGLSQTRSGYGAKLVTPRIAVLGDGRQRRIYVSQWSNTGTAWIVLDGARRIIHESDILS